MQWLYDQLVERMVKYGVAVDEAMSLAKDLTDRAIAEDLSLEGAKIRALIYALMDRIERLEKEIKKPRIDDDRPTDWLYQELLAELKKNNIPIKSAQIIAEQIAGEIIEGEISYDVGKLQAWIYGRYQPRLSLLALKRQIYFQWGFIILLGMAVGFLAILRY